MEGNIVCLLPFLIIFTLTARLGTEGSALNISKVVFVSHPKTWSEAQLYCREKHTDLITLRTKEDKKKLSSFRGWIGLHHPEGKEWMWSKGNEHVITELISDLPTPGNNSLCVYHSHQILMRESCDTQHPFLCVDERLILVQQKMTWEEALWRCRQLRAAGVSVHPKTYDLASLSEENNVLLEEKKMKAVAQEVWVGLRFLAGEWFWVSSQAVGSSYLPQCPAHQQRCGALDVSAGMFWKTKNCNERKFFLCGIRQ